jgi:hypothetical protein
MSIYDLKINWLNSTETVSIDTLDLPRPRTQLATFENWQGAAQPVKYIADVVSVIQTETLITITLRYDSATNSQLDGHNEAWGESRIELSLNGPKAAARASWKDDNNGHLYDGVAKVKVELIRSRSLAEDLLDLLPNSSTEQKSIVLARLGQGKFRAGVIEAWKIGEKCPLTKIDVRELLVASHIKPWSECNDEERLDPANGLLLATHVDKLFDKHLISFEWAQGAYRLQLNPRVRDVAAALGVQEGDVLDVSNLGPKEKSFRMYMNDHHIRFKEKMGV